MCRRKQKTKEITWRHARAREGPWRPIKTHEETWTPVKADEYLWNELTCIEGRERRGKRRGGHWGPVTRMGRVARKWKSGDRQSLQRLKQIWKVLSLKKTSGQDENRKDLASGAGQTPKKRKLLRSWALDGGKTWNTSRAADRSSSCGAKAPCLAPGCPKSKLWTPLMK